MHLNPQKKGTVMSSAAKTNLTVAEYLAFERASESKHEFFDGDVFAMSSETGLYTIQ